MKVNAISYLKYIYIINVFCIFESWIYRQKHIYFFQLELKNLHLKNFDVKIAISATHKFLYVYFWITHKKESLNTSTK